LFKLLVAYQAVLGGLQGRLVAAGRELPHQLLHFVADGIGAMEHKEMFVVATT